MNNRFVRNEADYLTLPVSDRDGSEAVRLGNLIHAHSLLPGAHRTPAAEAGKDVLSHVKGKYGELLFSGWLHVAPLFSYLSLRSKASNLSACPWTSPMMS